MKKYIIAGAGAALVFLAVLILGMKSCKTGTAGDASGYVQADLNLIFQGETQEARQYLNASGSDLKRIYENGVAAFVENYLTGGIETEMDLSAKYNALMKEVFRGMRYEVREAVKKGDGIYEVEVVYAPVSLFTEAIPQIREDARRIEEAAKSGAYEGTEEEVQEMMNIEYLNHAYEYLETAYRSMTYAEKETFTFTVTEGKKHTLSMKEGEINRFIEQILALPDVAGNAQ